MVRHRFLALGLGMLLTAIAGRAAGAEPAGSPTSSRAAQVEFFEKNVRPVLATRCFDCHGPSKQKGGLRLDSREAILRGGDSGPAVKPGQPEESLLIDAVRYDGEPQMPPKGKLRDEEVAALSHWVKAGAVWPDRDPSVRPQPAPSANGPKVKPEDRAFWSFRPIQAVEPPPVRDPAWPRTRIDRFILAKLEEAGLRPVGPADKRTLIRRATFDLTGLPPTPEEVEAFLADGSPEAFARVVDRLLASPHYGERWGRYWLDVARYGEDQAHTFQARLYPQGYRYRDWVINAFNGDMPYDRFVIEQIAGDLLDGPGRDDRLAALGLLALGPAYYGKAVFDELDDRVDTLTRGFLGLTVACARCHDHKFDPIPTEDYYALAGIFSCTEYKEYPQAPAEVVAEYERSEAAIKAKTQEVAQFLQAESARLAETMTQETARYMTAAWTFHNKRKGQASLELAEFAKAEGLREVLLKRWVAYLFPEPEKAGARPHLAGWRKLVAGQDPAADLSADEAARAEVRRVADDFQAYVRSTLALRDAIEAQRKAAKANGIEEDQAGKLALGPTDSGVIRDLISLQGLFAVPKDQAEKWLPDPIREALKTKRAELAKLKKEAPPKPPVLHGVAEGSRIADMRVLIRGNPDNLGPEVPRRFLSVLSAEDAPPFRQGSGRLELARAIASKDNPLTARVLVNRVWEHHFGRGLVATPSNFGALGERPTHPELLDDLASRFLAGGWSIKALHREIMLSSTYQLGSDFDTSNDAVDPDNTLLWRMNRRRLEVEAWRDAMLAVSGQLDDTVGGSSFDLAAPDGRRRTLYAAISRHDLNSLLRLFDYPDPNITSDKRTATTVPLQQLFVLNSEFIVNQARALAARLTGGPDESDADRIRRAFPILFARPASDDEVRWGLAFLAEPGQGAGHQDGRASLSKWEEYAQVLLGSNEFLYLD